MISDEINAATRSFAASTLMSSFIGAPALKMTVAALACRALSKSCRSGVASSSSPPEDQHAASTSSSSSSSNDARLTPAESAALLYVAGVMPSSDAGRLGEEDDDDDDYDDHGANDVRLCATRILRSEAARVVEHHRAEEAIEFGRGGGVKAAVQLMVEWLTATRTRGEKKTTTPLSGTSGTRSGGGGGGARGEKEEEGAMLLRLAVDGAAALADMVAVADANKTLALDMGGVDALVGCVERVICMNASAASAADEECAGRHRNLTDLAIQACRALGNLADGWDVDEIKEAIGARGAAAVVAAVRSGLPPRPAPSPLVADRATRSGLGVMNPEPAAGKKQDKEDEVDNEDDVYDDISALFAQASTEADEEEDIIGEKSSSPLYDPVNLRRCVALLEAMSAADEKELAESPRFREVRRALEPLHRRFAARQSVILEWERKKQLERERQARKTRQAYQDRRHRDTTLLRKGRINRLKELCESGGGGGGDGDDDDDGQAEGEHTVGALLGDGQIKYLSQVPDGAVREERALLPLPATVAAGESGVETPSARALTTTTTAANSGSLNESHDGDDDDMDEGGKDDDAQRLYKARQCYTCKARFTVLHHFYAAMCPNCAAVNYKMRHFAADLTGRFALLTGARVKIGFEIGLKLLRAGASLVATTRFPADAAKRYAAESDFDTWRHRLQIHAVDLRDVSALERFCDFLKATLPRLDVVVNNACQTVRRPVSYYSHLLPAEQRMEAAVRAARIRAGSSGIQGEEEGGTLAREDDDERLFSLLAQHALRSLSSSRGPQSPGGEAGESDAIVKGGLIDGGGGGGGGGVAREWDDPDEFYPTPAQLSQLKVAPEDHTLSVTPGLNGELPAGRLDVNGQQIDLRTHNSWLLKLEDVSVPELVEVMAINTLAPFLLNSRLQPLLAATAKAGCPRREDDKEDDHGKKEHAAESAAGAAFIVNVSAMEGKFYRHKTPNHPHTNMAKAALNMMTRTSAAELAKRDSVYMTAVDTGWINDENPRDRAARTAEVHHFQTPIDEVDAAARVLHPVFHGVATGKPLFGVFLKDFVATEW